jgi:His-Xaa-Ser system protein HxsD
MTQEISLNPKIYPLEALYSAAYVFLDRAYIRFEGDPDKEIKVLIKPKGDEEKIADEFMNELIN